MLTLIATTVAETLQKAAALRHTLTLADEALVLAAEPMMRWLDRDIEACEEESGTSA